MSIYNVIFDKIVVKTIPNIILGMMKYRVDPAISPDC